uniref:Immunoglobulin V-set domain-containing protein n=1 Tax=Seriola lalandi dorsalis TaxID=1841481 RepID=A0A3B4XDR5_SERLL
LTQQSGAPLWLGPYGSGSESGRLLHVTPSLSLTFSLTFLSLCHCPYLNKGKNYILIETTNNRARSGRYKMEYKEGSLNGGDLFVTIKQLTKSDSGRYRCRLGTSLSSYDDLEIIVTDGDDAVTTIPLLQPSPVSPISNFNVQ